MPMQSGKSPLVGKIKGIGGAMAGARGKPVEIGRSRLPAGINNGVAQLRQIGIGVYEQDAKNQDFRGKPYFSAMGVCVSPPEHEGTPVRGLQTWFQREPLFDTPKAGGKRKTLQDHYNKMRDHLVVLGFNPDAIEVPAGTADPDAYVMAAINAGCAALSQQKPYFRFRTWVGPKPEIVNEGDKWFLDQGRAGRKGPYGSKELLIKVNPYAESEPLINEQWEGACEFSDNGEVPPTVVDNTDGSEVASTEEAADEETTGTEESFGAELSAAELAELAKAATGGDNAAGIRLEDIAQALGVLGDATSGVKGADTWADGVKIILAAQAAASGGDEATEEATAEDEEAATKEETAPEETWKPAVGDVYAREVKDTKGKKKKVEITVTGVSTKNETVHANDNATKKPIRDLNGKPFPIKWADLKTPE